MLLQAADGLPIHGRALHAARSSSPARSVRAMIFFARRLASAQMLLGWHYVGYYHNAYGMNRCLASLGYVVLAVNYRSGIGYGLDFRENRRSTSSATGATEFNDDGYGGRYRTCAAGPDVDPLLSGNRPVGRLLRRLSHGARPVSLFRPVRRRRRLPRRPRLEHAAQRIFVERLNPRRPERCGAVIALTESPSPMSSVGTMAPRPCCSSTAQDATTAMSTLGKP